MIRNLIDHGVKIGCLGFIGFIGVMALASAVESIVPGPFILEEFVVKVAAGLGFGGAGLGVLYFLYGHEHLYPLWRNYRMERLGAQPWMRKRAWRTGRIPYRKRTPTVFLWIFAVGWNTMLATVLWSNRDLIAEDVRGNWLLVFPLAAFILIGLGVLYGAIRSALAKRFADRALFVMASVPAWTGGALVGAIQTRIPFGLRKQVDLKLASTESAPIKAEVPADCLTEGPKGLTIPVELAIPAGAAPTDEFGPDKTIVWTLEARMQLPKEDFEVRFEVPVYWKQQEE